MKKTVETILRQTLGEMGIEVPDRVDVELSRNEAFGHVASPVALTLAKALKKAPMKIAEDIVAALGDNEALQKVEIAGPGFINFTFKNDFFHKRLKTLAATEGAIGQNNTGRGRQVLVEFVSANPTGPLHLGHGRGAAVGDALCNILDAAGYKVVREYYVNDAGRQVTMLCQSVRARYEQLLGLDAEVPQDGYHGGYIQELARGLKAESGDGLLDEPRDVADRKITRFALDAMLEEIKNDLLAFGVRFDVWRSEKQLHDMGQVQSAVDYLINKGDIYDHDGALWFRATAYGDEKDRVVKKSDGLHTYFASDIAYHKLKIEEGHRELINIWGADHHGYIPRLKCVLEALGFSGDSLTVVLVQMVTLLRAGEPVQMSKRAGNFVTLKEVIDEVGADITRFIFLTRSSQSHLDFDLETAKSTSSENPVFYIQYAGARISSIFRHAVEEGLIKGDGDPKVTGADLSVLVENEELDLVKKLLLYHEAFDTAATNREPHFITYYLQELASLFHPYYKKHRVVTENRDLSLARLALLKAVKTVLFDGLKHLGISAPERM